MKEKQKRAVGESGRDSDATRDKRSERTHAKERDQKTRKVDTQIDGWASKNTPRPKRSKQVRREDQKNKRAGEHRSPLDRSLHLAPPPPPLPPRPPSAHLDLELPAASAGSGTGGPQILPPPPAWAAAPAACLDPDAAPAAAAPVLDDPTAGLNPCPTGCAAVPSECISSPSKLIDTALLLGLPSVSLSLSLSCAAKYLLKSPTPPPEYTQNACL